MKLFLIRSGLRLVRHPKLQLALISNTLWHRFGLILAHFRSIFGTFLVQNNTWSAPGTGLRSSFAFKYLLWVHSGIPAPFCIHFGFILAPFWYMFASILGQFLLLFGASERCSFYCTFMGPFWHPWLPILGPFSDKKTIKNQLKNVSISGSSFGSILVPFFN